MRTETIKYLKPLLDEGVEAIVLGCTHYPLIETLLRDLIPKNVRVVDPAIGVSRHLDVFLGSPQSLPSTTFSLSRTSFYVTGDPCDFKSRVIALLGECPKVDRASLQSKTCFS